MSYQMNRRVFGDRVGREREKREGQKTYYGERRQLCSLLLSCATIGKSLEFIICDPRGAQWDGIHSVRWSALSVVLFPKQYFVKRRNEFSFCSSLIFFNGSGICETDKQQRTGILVFTNCGNSNESLECLSTISELSDD